MVCPDNVRLDFTFDNCVKLSVKLTKLYSFKLGIKHCVKLSKLYSFKLSVKLTKLYSVELGIKHCIEFSKLYSFKLSIVNAVVDHVDKYVKLSLFDGLDLNVDATRFSS